MSHICTHPVRMTISVMLHEITSFVNYSNSYAFLEIKFSLHCATDTILKDHDLLYLCAGNIVKGSMLDSPL